MPEKKRESTVFRRLQAASDSNDVTTTIDLFNRFPAECWYGLSASQINDVLRKLPIEAHRHSLFVSYISKFLNGQSSDLFSREPVHSRNNTASGKIIESWDFVLRSMALRMSGYVRESSEVLPLPAAPDALFAVVDAVRNATLRLQRGTTLMLLCEFRDARKEFAAVHAVELPEDLLVLRRDALLKSALLEALYGDQRAARGHLRFAGIVPRTGSWLEEQLDAVTVLVTTLVAECEDLGAGLRDFAEYPLQAFGELWPFAVLGAQRIHDQLGRRAEFLAKLELYEVAAPGRIAGNGLPGSVLHIAHAISALAGGDSVSARAHIANADQSLLLTRRVQATLNMSAGAADQALRHALEMRVETKSLRQLEIWRTSLEVSALLAAAENAEAELMLRVLLQEMRGLNEEERRMFSAEVHAFADALEIQWPDRVENEFTLSNVPALPIVVLSERERQVLSQAVIGKSRAETAQALFVSENTVKTHLSSLYKKLDVANRAQLIAEARLRGLV